MKPEVVCEFGVEGGADDGALAYGDGPAVDGRERLDVRADLRDGRRADEDGRKGLVEARHVEVSLERVALTAEGVAVDGDVQEVERLDAVVASVARDDDQPSTGRKERLAGRGVVDDFGRDVAAVKQARDCR